MSAQRTREQRDGDTDTRVTRGPASKEPEMDEFADTYEGDRPLPASEDLPPRPRNRFLRPVPIALVALLIASGGFLAGVRVQKGQADSTTPSAASGLPSFSGAGGVPPTGSGIGATSAGAGATSALPGASGAGAAVTGTVKTVDGSTIYVTDSDGNTLRVRAAAGASVSRTSEIGMRAIHPGDTVVIQGPKKHGAISANSVTATAAGVDAVIHQLGSDGGTAGTPGSGQSSGDVGSLFQG